MACPFMRSAERGRRPAAVRGVVVSVGGGGATLTCACRSCRVGDRRHKGPRSCRRGSSTNATCRRSRDGSRPPCERSGPRLANSWISPSAMKISAGRSPWLCQGTMPLGSMVSLRNRNWRSLSFAGSFSRLMAPSVVSVTPTAANFTGSRASAFILSAGQLPAKAAVVKTADPMARPATVMVRPSNRPSSMRLNI
jgi:hypothetical protein